MSTKPTAQDEYPRYYVQGETLDDGRWYYVCDRENRTTGLAGRARFDHEIVGKWSRNRKVIEKRCEKMNHAYAASLRSKA